MNLVHIFDALDHYKHFYTNNVHVVQEINTTMKKKKLHNQISFKIKKKKDVWSRRDWIPGRPH